MVFGLFNIKGREFNFPIHFTKFLWLKVWMDEWMDGWMWKGKNTGELIKYWGGIIITWFLVYLIKGRDFNFVIHFNKLLWLKTWTDEWMNGWM